MVTGSASSESKLALQNVLLAHSLEDLGHTVVGVGPLELKLKVSEIDIRFANFASRNREISFGNVTSVICNINNLLNILLSLGLLPVIPESITIFHHVYLSIYGTLSVSIQHFCFLLVIKV